MPPRKIVNIPKGSQTPFFYREEFFSHHALHEEDKEHIRDPRRISLPTEPRGSQSRQSGEAPGTHQRLLKSPLPYLTLLYLYVCYTSMQVYSLLSSCLLDWYNHVCKPVRYNPYGQLNVSTRLYRQFSDARSPKWSLCGRS